MFVIEMMIKFIATNTYIPIIHEGCHDWQCLAADSKHTLHCGQSKFGFTKPLFACFWCIMVGCLWEDAMVVHQRSWSNAKLMVSNCWHILFRITVMVSFPLSIWSRMTSDMIICKCGILMIHQYWFDPWLHLSSPGLIDGSPARRRAPNLRWELGRWPWWQAPYWWLANDGE